MFTIQPYQMKTLSWWNSQRKNIDMEPSYQRKGGIWTAEDKGYLVDSILNGYDVPKLYLADFTYVKSPLNEKSKQFAVIDGKQRLEAIFDFFDGNLVLNEAFSYGPNPSLKLAGLGYKDLKSRHPDVASVFETYNLSVMSVITDEEGRINELFVRLNRSKPLTGSEIRSAMTGVVPKAIQKIADHRFFQTRIGFSTKRKQEYNAAAKILLIEFRGKFVDTKRTHLDRFVLEARLSQSTSLKRVVNKVVQVMTVMADVFTPADPLLRSQGPLTLYYWFVRNNIEHKELIREFLVRFESSRRENRQKVEDQRRADEELLRFDLMSRSVNDQGSLTERYRILEKRFRQFLLDADQDTLFATGG
jgi:Protein of unknown function DUF262